jgi:putative nucleotidyltransferase with HDIG domain
MSAFERMSKVGKAYMWSVPLIGAAVLAWALSDLVRNPRPTAWYVLTALTALTGSFTVKIPGLVARLSVSEPFVFAATFLFGPAAGAVTAALDALTMSLRLLPNLKTFHRVSFNVSVLVISIFAAGELFFTLAGIDPRQPEYSSLAGFIVPLYLFTLACFLLNSGLIAGALSFERRQSAFQIWRQQFLWLSLNYFGGASVAALIVLQYAKGIDVAVLGIIVPLLAIFYLTFRTTLGRLEDANVHLRELNHLYLSTIETLAMAVDAKDQVTHGHIRRVQRYAVGLATALGVTDQKQIQAIQAAALLHDMGKLAIPEYILNKPGRLTESEFEKMKLHAGIGAEILSAIEFPYPVVPIVRHHHENWDGRGYPDGLRGIEIPIGARILAVVDCFDALTSDRPYRPSLSNAEALQIIMARRGSMYDPLVVDTFVAELPRLTESLADIEPQSETLKKIANLNSPIEHPSRVTPTQIEEPQSADAASLLALLRSAPGTFELEDLALVVLGRLEHFMRVDTLAVYLVGPTGTTLVAAGAAGDTPEGFLGTSIEFGSRIAGWVAANRTPVRNSDPELDLGPAARLLGLSSSLVCPIIADEQLRGVLALYSTEREAFTAEHQRLAELLSSYIGRFCAERGRVSLVDSTSLTRAGRRMPDRQLLQEVFGSIGSGVAEWLPITVITVKSLRSALSSRGDAILDAVRTSVRLGDCAFKLSDSDFAVVMLRSSEDAAASVFQRITTQLQAKTLESGMAFELGVATSRDASENIDELIERVQRQAHRTDANSDSIH